MRKGVVLAVLLFAAIFASGCSETAEINETVKSEMRSAAKGFMTELKGVLVANMKSGGPVKAISVCADTAQELTKNYTEKVKLNLRRVSLKARNPKDKPDEFEKEILMKFDEMRLNDELSPETEIFSIDEVDGKKVIRYMKPIVTKSVCLNCHGDNNHVKPGVRKLIKEKYPDDTARNYKEGDVRGAISIVKFVENQ